MKKWREIPVEIQEKMLEHQETQTGIRDESMFEKRIGADSERMGFDWGATPEGLDFWVEIIGHENFDLFYKRYPKEEKKDKRFPLVAQEKYSRVVGCFSSEYDYIHIDNENGYIGTQDKSEFSCFNKEYWTIIAQTSANR